MCILCIWSKIQELLVGYSLIQTIPISSQVVAVRWITKSRKVIYYFALYRMTIRFAGN